MGVFALIVIAAVPVLYGLFWWLDYRWLAERPEPAPEPVDPELDEDW